MTRHLLASVLSVLSVCSSAQVIVPGPGIRSILAGEGITVETNGTTRVISAPGAAGDITSVGVSGGLLTGGGTTGAVTVGLATNAVVAALVGQDVELATLFAGERCRITDLDSYLDGLSIGGADGEWKGFLRYSPDGAGGTHTNATFGVVTASGVDLDLTPGANGRIILGAAQQPVTVIGALAFSGSATFNGGIFGNGGSITNLSASALSSGTVPDARFPATLPAVSGANLTNLDAGDLTGSVADARLSTAARSETFTGSAWVGPKVTETPGWVPKSYATTNLYAVVEGLVAGATQADGTISSVFVTPADSSGWAATGAITLELIGDSVTSSASKYRLYVFKDGSTSAVYDSGADQVVSSTSDPTAISIAGSSLGTFAASTRYTVQIVASVTTSGLYPVGQPKITVQK